MLRFCLQNIWRSVAQSPVTLFSSSGVAAWGRLQTVTFRSRLTDQIWGIFLRAAGQHSLPALGPPTGCPRTAGPEPVALMAALGGKPTESSRLISEDSPVEGVAANALEPGRPWPEPEDVKLDPHVQLEQSLDQVAKLQDENLNLRLRLKLARAAMMVRAARFVMILIWSNASIVVSAKKPVQLMQLLKVRILNLQRKLAKSFITTRINSLRMGIVGNVKLHGIYQWTHLTGSY